jgi:hypothetical protein
MVLDIFGISFSICAILSMVWIWIHNVMNFTLKSSKYCQESFYCTIWNRKSEYDIHNCMITSRLAWHRVNSCTYKLWFFLFLHLKKQTNKSNNVWNRFESFQCWSLLN